MIRDDDFQRSTIALQVSSNLIKIEKADPSHIVGLNTAISLARTESYDRQLLDALYALFDTASGAGIVKQEHV